MKVANSKNEPSHVSVLLVEDAAPVRQRLASRIGEIPNLQLIGQACSVAEARNLFDSEDPTVVLLTLGLPDGTGIDVLRHVREANSRCVVIILSNNLDQETYNRCSELGADFLYSKSLEFELAMETLRALSDGAVKGMQDSSVAERVRRTKLVVTSPVGLHARPAAMLVKLAQSFDAHIEVSLNGQSTSAKSILGLMTLCAGYGEEIQVTAIGEDAHEAILMITALFEGGFTDQKNGVAPCPSVDAGSTQQQSQRDAVTIMVVDDEASIRSLVQTMLNGCGYQTVTACNGIEAIALLTANRHTIKAVVLDIVMPEMGGIEALSTIRRMRPNLPVLAMSGYPDVTPVGSDAVTAFLRKPFNAPQLVSVLQTLIERSGTGQ